jgi:hypothetical protein
MLNVGDWLCNGCGMRQPFVPPELLDNRAPSVSYVHMPAVTSRALVPVYGLPLPRRKKGVTPYLVWSLILVPFVNIIGSPLAVAAAMFCLAAGSDNEPDSDGKLGKAAVLCVIATVVDVVTLVLLAAYAVLVLKRAGGA